MCIRDSASASVLALDNSATCSAGEGAVPLTRLFHGSDEWLDGESGLTNRYTLWRASATGGRAIRDAVAAWKRLLADRGVLPAIGCAETRRMVRGYRLRAAIGFSGIPLARQQRGREEEEAGIAQLLLRYGVAAGEATADRQAASKSLSRMSAACVEHNLEALRFLGWDTHEVSPATILHAGPKLVSRTAFCRAHGYARTTTVCCTAACCIAVLSPGLRVECPEAQYPGIVQPITFSPRGQVCAHGRSKQ